MSPEEVSHYRFSIVPKHGNETRGVDRWRKNLLLTDRRCLPGNLVFLFKTRLLRLKKTRGTSKKKQKRIIVPRLFLKREGEGGKTRRREGKGVPIRKRPPGKGALR